MGLSFQSFSFRRPQNCPWNECQSKLTRLFFRYGIPVADLHLDEERLAYGYCTSEYDRNIANQELLTELSRITGDYVVGASCVDSDFLLLVLLHNGQELDNGSIGHNWFAEELGEEPLTLSMDRWLPLLENSDAQEELVSCLLGDSYICIEDAARDLRRLTGLPIIDDDALLGDDFFSDDY